MPPTRWSRHCPGPGACRATRRTTATLLAALLAALLASSGTVAGTAAAASAGPPNSSVLPASPARAAPPAADAALRVSIDRMTPPTRPAARDLVLTGRVRNVSEQTWTNVRVYPFRGAEPVRSSDALAQAAATPAASPVGSRVTADPWVIDELAPGQTVRYRVRLTPDQLALEQPGVYWVGAHALGTSRAGRADGADGRARTFLPLVPRTGQAAPQGPPARVALVLPLRHRVRFTATGRVDGLDGWRRELAPGGRLDALLGFAEAAGGRPLTWLVDPAVLDALARLTQGNPARGPRPAGSGPAPSASPRAAGGTAQPEALPAAQQQLAERAQQWLQRFRSLAADQRVLALPYADLDVAAVARHDRPQQRAGVDLRATARRRGARTLAALGIEATPVTAPAGGRLTPAAARAARGLVIVEESGLSPAGEEPVPTAARFAGSTVLTTTPAFAAGGPGPDPRFAPVALRQRFLAEAAVRALGEQDGPSLAVLPPSWTPGDGRAFFAAADTPWLELVPLTALTPTPGSADPSGASGSAGLPRLGEDAFSYPAPARRAEVPPRLVRGASRTLAEGRVLDRVLAEDPRVAEAVADAGLTAVSATARDQPDRAAAGLARTRAWIRDRLGRVTVGGPQSVTLSGGQGTFPVQVSNGLAARVRVTLRVGTDEGVSMRAPRQVVVGPGRSRTVRVRATTSTLGVHPVTLTLSDGAGTAVGRPASLSLRSAQVSGVIWVILGAAVAVLVGAVALRLRRGRSA